MLTVKNTLILLFAAFTLSSCLTRRNAIPSEKKKTNAIRKKNKGTILTDVSSLSGNVPASGNTLNDYANALGVPPEELRNKNLYLFIDQWMGTPYRLGGTDRNGVDCSGFTNMLVNEVYGADLPRSARDMAEAVKRKYEEQLKEGDLVFFSFGKQSFDHVGVYLRNHKFVHASTSKGVIISDLRDPWYYKYFVRAGSVR